MVNHLGASPTYNTKPLWTYQAGPTAAGLLSDPTYRLLNLMNRSRLPEGEGLDSGILMKEHILDRKLQREKSLDQQLQSESSTDGASTIPGSRDTNESLTTLSKISVPRDVSDTASDNLHSSESGSESDSVHTVIRTPTKAPIEEHTTPISNIDIQDKNSPLAKPTKRRRRQSGPQLRCRGHDRLEEIQCPKLRSRSCCASFEGTFHRVRRLLSALRRRQARGMH
jgi:hypothetical protein